MAKRDAEFEQQLSLAIENSHLVVKNLWAAPYTNVPSV